MRRSSLIFLSFLLTLPVAAQSLEERVTVELVQVPVFVFRNGAAIRDLKREDFELFVNGDRQPIEFFETASFEGKKSEAPALRSRRLFLLLFDLEHSSSYAFGRAREAARAYVTEGVSRGDSFGVALFTSNGGVQLVTPFTRDARALDAALATFRTSRSGDVLALSTDERLYMGRPMEMFEEEPESLEAVERSPNRIVIGTAAALQADHERIIRNIHHDALEVRSQGDMIDELGEFVGSMQSIDGQKHVILFSEGFGMNEAPTEGAIDLTTSSKLGKMHARFRKAGVFLDAVDVRGKRDPFETSKNDALFALAFDTGGHVVHEAHDLVRGLGTLREMKNVTYILSFKPPANARPRNNTIRVKVRNQKFGTDVRYRKAFDAIGSEPVMSELYVADVMLNDIPQNGLDVDLGVAGSGKLVQLNIAIDGKGFLLPNKPRASADAFIYIFAKDGTVAGWSEKRVNVDLAAAGDYYDVHPVAFTDRYALQPGDYVAKVLIRSDTAGVTGFARHKFKVVKRTDAVQ